MTHLRYKIQAYLGREISLQNDVEIEKDESGVETINEWYTTDKPKPTDAQLDALSSQATALENTAKIDAKRQKEYLSWQQQFEMIYKDQKNGTTTYKDHCDKVRSDNPKE